MLADWKPRSCTSVAPYLIVAFAEAGIGEVEGPGTVGDQGTLARGPDGRLYLSTPFDPGMIKVFAGMA